MSKVFTCFYLSNSWINREIDIPAEKYAYNVQTRILFSGFMFKNSFGLMLKSIEM